MVAGALLFQLEPDPEQSALAEAEQRLERSRAQLADLLKSEREEELAVIRAQLEQARAQWVLSEKQLQRQQELRACNLGSTAAVDEARSQRDHDAARVEELKARLRTAELAAQLAPLLARLGARGRPRPTRLEDVFIQLMGQARDNAL